MNLGRLEQSEIQNFFRLDERIDKVRMCMEDARQAFYDQTMSGHSTDNGIEVMQMGFNPDRVIRLVDVTNSLHTFIERLRTKKELLHDYLNTLDPTDKESLIKRYTGDELPDVVHLIDAEVFNKIQDIHKSVNSKYGYPEVITREHIRIDDSTTKDNVKSVAELLGA